MDDKTLVEEARAWPGVEWDALSAGKVGELLNKLADENEAQATHIEALEARLEITDPSDPYDGIYARDETIRLLDQRIETFKSRIEALEAALRRMIYETTHLSPMKPNGDHDCTIKADALAQARQALESQP